jgi:predicted nuclease of predicted toxin-antitoxin system
MKLLLDENLSRRLVPFLQDAYPGTTQVVLAGLESADDAALWEYAKAHGFVIVTQDADFQERSLVLGSPPKVIWLRLLNPSKAQVLRALLDRQVLIQQSLLQESTHLVELLP